MATTDRLVPADENEGNEKQGEEKGREVLEEGENGGLSRILASVGFHLKYQREKVEWESGASGGRQKGGSDRVGG